MKICNVSETVLSPASGGTYSVGLNLVLIPISRHKHQHKMGYVNQAQHKQSARANKNSIINNVKNTIIVLIYHHITEFFDDVCLLAFVVRDLDKKQQC
jgi:hypothetical protein